MSERIARLDPWYVHQRLFHGELSREAVFADIAAEMGFDMSPPKDDPDTAAQKERMKEMEREVARQEAARKAAQAKEAAEAEARERRARGQ